jgi:hypothetical protein
MRCRYKSHGTGQVLVKSEVHRKGEASLCDFVAAHDTLAERLAAVADSIRALDGPITDDLIRLYCVVCHDFSNFVWDKDKFVLDLLLQTPFIRLLIDFILQFSQVTYYYSDEDYHIRAVVPALEVMSACLSSPAPDLIEFILESPEFTDCIDNFLSEDGDEDLLYYCLEIIACNACEFRQMNIPFSKVYKFSFDRIMILFNMFDHQSKVRRALIMSCRFICESERLGCFMLHIAVFLCSIYDLSIDCLAFFPILFRLVKEQPLIISETPEFMSFIETRLCDFVCPRELCDPNGSLTREFERVSDWALKILLKVISVLPELAQGLVELVAVDDIVFVLQHSANEKLLARVLDFLSFRCSESSWIFALLLDSQIELYLQIFFCSGTYRLKSAAIRLWRLVITHERTSSMLDRIVTEDFFLDCNEFLTVEFRELTGDIIEFLLVIFDMLATENVGLLRQALASVDLQDSLMELAVSDGQYGERAALAANAIRQLVGDYSLE